MNPMMIFHLPMGVRSGGSSGSAIRPFMMRTVFAQLGYKVIEVSGTWHEHAQSVPLAKQAVEKGRVEFCYSELAAGLTAMTEKISERVSPALDSGLFAFCRARGVPVGAFYRDVYWRSPNFLTLRQFPYHLLMRHHYKHDLRRLEDSLDLMFLPSLRVGEYIPRISPEKFRELPPGAPLAAKGTGTDVELFYVGALGDFYDLRGCVTTVAETPGASMTPYVPEEQRVLLAETYRPYLSHRVRVVHGRGVEPEPHFGRATIGVLAMKPIEHRSFTAPMKFFEYTGCALSVLASAGTHIADPVVREGIGWTPEYSRDSIARTLREFVVTPSLVKEAASRAEALCGEHTWQVRVCQAAAMLAEIDQQGRA